MDPVYLGLQLYASLMQFLVVMLIIVGIAIAAGGSIYCLRPVTRAGLVGASSWAAGCVLAAVCMYLWLPGDDLRFLWLNVPFAAAIFSPWIGVLIDWRISARSLR